MRCFIALCLIVICHGKSLCAQSDADAPAIQKRVMELVAQLGDASFAKRVRATKLLEEVGEVALPALRAVVRDSARLEVRLRAGQAIIGILRSAGSSDSSGLELVVIEAGHFSMGSPNSEPGRRSDEWSHPVEIARPFLLGKYEVTQSQYEAVMRSNPSEFLDTALKNGTQQSDDRGFPVERVTWYDAVAFCNRLSEQDGFDSSYDLNDVTFKGPSIIRAKVIVTQGNGYRLPTEAQWEYACRGATVTPFYFGKRNTGRESNVKSSTRKGAYGIMSRGWKDLNRTTPVGTYPANQWGLHDMLGNVAEWVDDWYGKGYYHTASVPVGNSRVKDPIGPLTGRHRVLRGGCWLLTESHSRAASRFYHTPNEARNYVGFRVARIP